MVDIIDATESKTLQRAENNSAYAQRLAAVLGNGADWDYRGECIEVRGGVCACGHTGLRYLFPIYHRHNGRTEHVGSSCIETYAEINPAMVEGIKAAADEARRAHLEKIRAAKRAAETAEVQTLAEIAAQGRADLFERVAGLQDYQRVPYDVWRITGNPRSARETFQQVTKDGGKFKVTIPPMKTARGQKARLEKIIRDYEALALSVPARQSWY